MWKNCGINDTVLLVYQFVTLSCMLNQHVCDLHRLISLTVLGVLLSLFDCLNNVH